MLDRLEIFNFTFGRYVSHPNQFQPQIDAKIVWFCNEKLSSEQ